MANLTVGDNVSSATYSLNKSIDVSNSLTLRDFSTLGIANSYLNLKSTVSNTARIAPVPDNANITYGSGRFVIERYYPSRRAWRLVTAPVTADLSNTVFNSWQMGGQASVGSGTFVTGPGADPVSNGLDMSPQNNFSLKIFDKVTGAQVGVSNSKTQLISGTDGVAGSPDNIGMFLFVRGDRSTTNLFNTSFSNITTLRDTGKAQIHGQSFKLDGPAGGFGVVGNPYASPVDVSTLVRGTANINPDFFWVFDPYLNSEQGGWITMDWNGSGWNATPASPGGLTKDIQSSQAFFVQKNNGAQGSMNFTEPLKSTSYTASAFRPLAGPARFATSLYLKDADSITIADGNLVAFDASYNSEVDFSDALKFGNTKETFYMMRNTKALSVERRQPVTVSDTIFFKLSKTTQRNYQFKFVPTNMDPLLTAYLEDSYTGINTALSLTSVNTFDFSVNGDAKSAATDRFRIVFKNAETNPLAVSFSNIRAFEKGKDIAVEWVVENELNVLKYIVEKSDDGVNFSNLATILAKGANSGTSLYEMLDINPLPGNNFYRILSVSLGGSTEYSSVVLVKTAKKQAAITIYPNPVKDNTIGVAFNNVEKGVYGIKLINTLGQTMLIDKINIPGGNSTEMIRPRSSLAPGIYQLEVSSPGKQVNTIKVIVQ